MKRISLFALFLVICLAAGLYFSGERLADYVGTTLRSGEGDRLSNQVDRVEEALRQDEVVAEYVPGQVLIRFKKTVTREQISDFYAEYGLSEKDNLDNDPDDADQGLRLAGVAVDVDEQLIEVLESDARVAYAEPNYFLNISETPPDDPLFEKLWNLHNTGQTGGTVDADIDALEAWEIGTGSHDVIIAVIDTGVDVTHEDLQANLWTNTQECPQGVGKCRADGVDDDGNGYVDDFHGINAITNSGALLDDYGHGTHVAGIAAAAGDNRKGVVGVSWNAKILGCKFITAFGSGTTSNAVKCFNYIHDLRNKQKINILVTNSSWGGGSPSRALREAMGRVDSPLHVASAGNSNSNRKLYPAAYDLDNIISVTATDHDDVYAGFSSWGEDWVDLAAPGVNILSTIPDGRCPMCLPSGYGATSGTSMSAPYVAGAAALIWSEFEGLNNQQVKQRILSGVDPLPPQSKKTLTNGRLNLFNSMEKDSTPPATVTDLSPSGILLTKILLSWTATGDDGFTGQSTAYDVRYDTAPISNATWDSAQRVETAPIPGASGSREALEVTGLEPDTTYYFALRVADNVGNVSDLSNIVIARTSAGTIVFEDDMENGSGKWTIEDADDSLWHLSSLRFNSPETSWYYGRERQRDYDTGEENEGTITTGVIDIAGADDALLTFHEWSELQSNTRYDRTRVQISTDGTTWRTVFESHGTEGRWARRDVDLSQAVSESGSIQVRFWIDTVDERFNDNEGWYIDDVQVVTAKLQLPGERQLLPNLLAQSINIGFNPSEPHAGETTTIHGTVLNNGNADARAVSVQFVDVTDEDAAVPIGLPQTIAEIPVGGSGVVQVQYDTEDKSGERSVRMVIDPNNFVSERNEADNAASRVLDVAEAPAPNLYVDADNIGFNPASPQLGAQVTILATIVNNGTADATSVTVQFREGRTTPVALNQVIDSIPAGSSAVASVTYDSGSSSGDPSFTVTADPDNFITELDETDNSARKTLTLQADAEPNLELSTSNIGIAPSNPVQGDEVTIYATILNAGNSEVQDVQVQFLNANASPAAPIAALQVIPAIAPGSSGVASIRFDTSNRSGDQKIQVQVDPHNLIAESSERDNSATATLSVEHRPAPNLVVVAENIGFSATEVAAGTPVTIYATILNTGSARAENVNVQFVDVTSASVRPVGEQQTIEVIEPGTSAVAVAQYKASGGQGSRTVQVVADPGNFIREVSEEDNEASASLTVGSAPAPNLFIHSNNIAIYPDQPVSGEEVTLRAVVGNNGSAPAEHVSVQFFDVSSGEARLLGSEQTISEIGVGSSGTAAVTITESISADRPIGNRKIQVLVDANNRIRESNEEDNTATRLLTLQPEPMPNLVVLAENIGFSPTNPRVGETVTILAVVRNDGDVVARNVVVQFEDVSAGRPTPIGEPKELDRIAVGGSGVVTVKFTIPDAAGTYKVRVVADPGNFITENNEIDNKGTRNLEVGAAPMPNLVALAENIGFNPPDATAGDEVVVSLTVLNNGAAEAKDVHVQFTDITNGRLRPIGEVQEVSSIAAGDSAIASVTYRTAGLVGERRIKASVDGLSIIAEIDETDNTASKTILVTAGIVPNLAVHAANISFAPLNPNSGDEIKVRAVVRNQGSEDVENVDVHFLDATNDEAVPIGPSQLIAKIPAGSSAIAESVFDSRGKTGERKIRVLADRSNLISESDEEDNQAEATVTINPPAIPNLVIESRNVGFHPSRPVDGDQVTINATVLNDGGGDATEVIVQFVEGSGRGIPIGEPQVIDRIPAGSSGVAQVVFDTAGKDDPRVQVIVDPNNYIAETKETDNRATAALKMADRPLANLVVNSTNLAYTPKSPREGQRIIVTAVIVNHGSAPARDVDVQFMDATERPAVPVGAAQTISLIPAGGSAAVGIVYDTTDKEGARQLNVIADPGNFVVESSESDNMARKTVEVLERSAPNLIVQPRNVGFNPATPTEGERVLIRAVVLNDGAEDATDVVVQFLDVTEAGVTPIGQPFVIAFLAAGSSATAPIVYDTLDRPGDRRIRVVVDPNSFIRESSKEDNQTVVTLPVQAAKAPNLAMLSGNIKFDPPSPELYDKVTVSATVLNNGTETAHDVIVQFLDVSGGGSVQIGAEQLLDAVPAGGGGTVEVTYTDTEEIGSRQIRVIVDPNNVIAEVSERDNRATRGVVISPPQLADVTVSESDVEFDPEEPVEGKETTISATIANQGNAQARGFVVRFMDVTGRVPEPIGGPQRIDLLGANDSTTVSVTYDTLGKAGDRKIRVVADSEDAVKESDEENNRAEKILRVRTASEASEEAANLVILSSNIRFFPALPKPGDPVTITAVVRNRGEEAAENVIVLFEDATEEEATVIGEFTITNPIQPGARELAVMTFDTTDLDGSRIIRVTADPDDEISETDEEDNTAQRTLRFGTGAVGSAPGTGEDVSTSPPVAERDGEKANLTLNASSVEVNVIPGDDSDLVIVVATVQNQGVKDVDGFAVHVLDVNDGFSTLGSVQMLERLAAGSETTVRTVFRAAGGIGLRTLQVVVEPLSGIAESSVQDNRVSVLVSGVGAADQ
jgi:subtilase family serine protease/subtilisin family serine protease